jgi:hypothetical protein
MATINSKLRCFGLFKVKNRKDWKISEKHLQRICEFDKIANEEFLLHITKSSLNDLQSW